MKILVINTGSSSIKYQLFDLDHNLVLASGLVERIGEANSRIIHQVFSEKEDTPDKSIKGRIADHRDGLVKIVDLLTDKQYGVIRDKSEIFAVGHRVVHGGESFRSPTIIDEKVVEAIRKEIPLAPLHNPPNLIGIEVAQSIFSESPQVAVFDTSFHQTIPPEAFLYALPYELYTKDRIRRYGFHGTSHSYIAERAAEYLCRPLDELNLITIHLGNGASMAALKRGKCIDTSMGMTPLEGLVMGTRCGDLDPAIPFFLANYLKMSLKDIDQLLNKDSGLKGLCGTNDMREVMDKIEAKDERAEVALKVYTYRIKKYIGAYLAVLEDLDAIIFTAGIGENSPVIRELCCQGLNKLGIEIDLKKNSESSGMVREINSSHSPIKILVIATNEELKIALETKRVIENEYSN